MLYVDGDESFTQGGTEYTIGEEVAMKRAENENFYTKFDAIDRFVKITTSLIMARLKSLWMTKMDLAHG